MTILYDLLMLAKMRELIRIILVCVCAFLLAIREGKCQDVESSGSVEDPSEVETAGARSEEQGEQKKDKASLIPGGVRRASGQSNSNATRDSQLLSLLAARRRQLLNGRLATHLNTIASLASRANKNTTTFAQLVIRDANNSVVKRITFDNSSNMSTPTVKVITTDGSTEIKEDLKPQEVRHILLPKLFQENRSRAGFINNKRKSLSTEKLDTLIQKAIETGAVYIAPEGIDKEAILEPDEEFQVDESNHGLYLLNYSDTENVTTNQQDTSTVVTIDDKEKSTVDGEVTTPLSNIIKDDETEKPSGNKTEIRDSGVTANDTGSQNTNPKLGKVENQKDKENNTLFMSDEIYNHFRALESELPVEEMEPFIYFGQKIGGQIINDNLTNSPSLSASTKTINYIVPPPEKRKYNSRYSVTEKYKNISANEEEINEDMDVSVVKNVIEKNKVRNTVKGPAPPRHVGLVNAYRKYISTTAPSIQSNVIEPLVHKNASSFTDKSQESYPADLNNNGNLNNNTFLKDGTLIRINGTIPRNYTRNYFNLRRSNRITTSTENSVTILSTNSSIEKTATAVYTAVVTSVSITSSMKGQNKTEQGSKNNTVIEGTLTLENSSNIDSVNNTEITSIVPNTRNHRHRIRIRTTSTESSIDSSPSPASILSDQIPIDTTTTSNLTTNNSNNKVSSVIIDKPVENSVKNNITSIGSSLRPKRRRRPTTTTTTTTTTSSTTEMTDESTVVTTPSNMPAASSPRDLSQNDETTENTFQPFIVTSKTSSESSSKPKLILLMGFTQTGQQKNKTMTNATKENNSDENNQNEVFIEAEKNYTASYVLAGLGFLPVAAIIIFILRNVYRKKTKEIETEYEGYFEDSDIKKESPITPVARPPLPIPSKPDQKWEFPRNKLRLQTLLGQGNFGQVWKAEADDLNGHDGLTRLVAVKSIKETASQKEKQELLHEIYIMQKIGPHPNVVTLLACCTEQEPYLLIMEYVMCGKLLTFLRERRARPDRFGGSGTLAARDLTVFAYCVARGMDYIASKGIVHRDLAARNVLVDHNKLCKIADFGMSRCAGAAPGRHALPVRWMAPEALLYNVYSHPSDVWAFGILLWEIVTLGSTPYAAMSGREVLSAVTEGYRLERPAHCKPQLYRAMHSCWHADPAQRPTFAQLRAQLAQLLDNEPAEGNYVDLDSFYQESSVYSDPSAIIHDEEGLSAEYDRERRCFRELNKGPANYDNRAFTLRDEELRSKFGIGTPRMGGFGIRDIPFNERAFSDGDFNERSFTDKNFNDRSFTDKNFTDTDFTERKDGKLSTSSFHRERERERENPLVSRNSFNGFPRIGSRDNHFQLPDGRNKRVPEFECDI